jgi:alanyl-tRNA synthetase
VTERLYYTDSTLLDFSATVVGHDGDATRVLLDRTAFYPTSGGQPHDVGRLGGTRVLDVLDRDDAIIHVVDAPVPLGPVRGVVDAARRRDHMQQHSAQHLLSALAEDRWQWQTVSVHFGAADSTIEFATATITDLQLGQLEAAANQAVASALLVRVSQEDATTATGLRKPTGRRGPIRIVTIEGVDRSACGGTHVMRTSEIGAVLLTGIERIRGQVRMAFVAGDRVLAQVRAAATTLQRTAAALHCAVPDLPDVAATRQDETRALRQRADGLEAEVALNRIDAIDRGTPPRGDDVRRVVVRYTDELPSLLRQLASAVASRTRLVLVLAPVVEGTIYLATSADAGVDAGVVLKRALAAHGGRGGGSPRAAQGSVPADRLAAVLDALISP